MSIRSFKAYLIAILYSLSISCNSPIAKDSESNKSTISYKNNFTVLQKGDCFELNIIEVFPNSNISEKYCLCPHNTSFPDGDYKLKINIPVKRVGINSTTHLGFINVFNQNESIKAATNTDLYFDEEFNNRIKDKELQTLGKGKIETELLIDADLDVVFTYAIDAVSYQEVERLRNLGQDIVLISEFMEHRPLNKAAWLEVFALFYGKQEKIIASKYLNKLKVRYDSLTQLALHSEYKSKCILGLPWKGNWYVSGGESYQANFIKDAGGFYTWNNLKYADSRPIALEKVLLESLDADIWLNPGRIYSKEEILLNDSRFKEIKAFKSSSIYSHYKRSNEKGANDYWESGVVEPDLILADLISILHPDLMEGYLMKYYSKIDE